MFLKPWDKLPSHLQNEDVRGYYLILKKKRLSLFIKRIFDLVLALIMCILLSPVFLIVAILIKVDSKGPVFYRQRRITTYGLSFHIFKFRTMIVDADLKGSLVTLADDNRITRVGKKIRKCRLDEIPQILNIVKGEMSFVGTRPEVDKYVKGYSNEMLATLLLPAGVTSLASIEYKDEDAVLAHCIDEGMGVDEAYIKGVLPLKMQYNLDYIKQFNFFKDIAIMFKTFFSVIS